jgi:hypothetical protein
MNEVLVEVEHVVDVSDSDDGTSGEGSGRMFVVSGLCGDIDDAGAADVANPIYCLRAFVPHHCFTTCHSCQWITSAHSGTFEQNTSRCNSNYNSESVEALVTHVIDAHLQHCINTSTFTNCTYCKLFTGSQRSECLCLAASQLVELDFRVLT